VSKIKLALTYDDVQIIPKFSKINSRSNCNLRSRFTKNYVVDVPIIASPMDTVTGDSMMIEMHKLGGAGILHRFSDIDEQVRIIEYIEDQDVRLIPSSIGVKESSIQGAELLLKAGSNVLLIDVAHGDHAHVERTIKSLKDKYSGKYEFDIIAGNIATAESAENLIRWGADALRVGIGGGCFIPGSKVRTENGLKNIEDITIDDRVWTHTGDLQRVVDTLMFDRDEDIMRINDIECTKNHEFYVIDAEDVPNVTESNIHKFARWIPAEKLSTQHKLIELIT